jgi:mannose/fructose/N-acetylgalactosamine-specific phosphotransferase system component IID
LTVFVAYTVAYNKYVALNHARLAAKLTETKSEKEKIAQEIQSKQDYLDTLQPKLSAILQVSCVSALVRSVVSAL